MSIRIKKNLAGFTLIELSVSIFIVALISGVFLVNYHNTSKRSQLNATKQRLASDIRMTQNYSLGSKTYDGAQTPEGGWGVHFALSSPSNYTIFADKAEIGYPNGNKAYDSGEAVEIKTLPAGVTINSLIFKNPVNTLDIIFFPPNPDIYLNTTDVFNRPGGTTDANIILNEDLNNSTAQVTVNYFGLIDTE